MAHDHAHSHAELRRKGRRRLVWTLVLVVGYMGAEIVGGLLTGSLALLADAAHMASDAGSLGLALFAIWLASRPAGRSRTYGYHRSEILAALANGVTLVVVAGLILHEAWERFRAPVEVEGWKMMGIALGGLAVNLACARLLWSEREASLNLKGAWAHVLADLLGSVQAVVAGLLIGLYGWRIADPIASVLIALLVLGSSWRILRDSVHVLMEGAPRHLDPSELEAEIAGVPGVIEVHDLHVWTITSGFDALSAHACVDDRDRDEVLGEVLTRVRRRFGITHATIQIEAPGECHGRACCP